MAIWVIVVASAVLVFLEAGRDEKLGYSTNRAGWTAATLLLWIVGFPAYLMHRASLHQTMVEQHGDTPQPMVALGLAWGFYVLGVVLLVVSVLRQLPA